MRALTIRELEERLSEYLRLVRNGARFLVTDGREVVAELGPPRPGLARAHGIRPRQVRLVPNRPDLYRALGPVLPAGTAARLLDEERGDR